MSRSKTVLALAVAAIGVVAVVAANQLLRPRETPADRGLSERLERTEARLGNVQRELAATRRAAAAGAPATPSVLSVATPTLEAAELAEPAEDVDPVSELDETLETEGTDPGWWRTAERDLATAYANPKIARSHAGEVRCATSLCRMIVTHDDAEANQEFREQVALLNPFPRSSVLVQERTDAGGRLSSIVFVARSGHGLANAETALRLR